jgi:hypothetical protein
MEPSGYACALEIGARNFLLNLSPREKSGERPNPLPSKGSGDSSFNQLVELLHDTVQIITVIEE